MDIQRIAGLLQPFVTKGEPAARSPGFSGPPAMASGGANALEESGFLSPELLHNISTYIDILIRWNARMNLTAVREPDEIVTRHFGESLFAGGVLFPNASCGRLIDVGAGAGFPGLPIKILRPDLQATLIESNQKKATFLREVIRGLNLSGIDVFHGRAEDYPAGTAEVATLRAVEKFESALPVAAKLLANFGRIALLIGDAQAPLARKILPQLNWAHELRVPLSASRILLVGAQSVDRSKVSI